MKQAVAGNRLSRHCLMHSNPPFNSVTITSAEEQAHVYLLAAATCDNNRYWIGLDGDAAAPGGFKWVTGEPYGYSNWAPNEPYNNPAALHTAKMYGPQTGKGGQWYTKATLADGFNYAAFICEWEDYATFEQAGTVLDKDGDGLPDFMETGGIPLPNGRIVYTDPSNPDTDGDGILDGDEISLRIQIVDWDVWHNPIYGMTGFIFRSSPTAIDSDGDGVTDSHDSSPFKQNGEMNYIFYDKNETVLRNEALHREKLMKKDGKSVEMIIVNSTDGFVNRWNQMGLDRAGKEEYKISNVYTVYHGSRDRFTIKSQTEYFYTSDIYRLNNKKIDVLNLSSCMNGNLDFINNWSHDGVLYGQNMAVMMMKGCSNIKTVKAWDGVATYLYIGDYVKEWDSTNSYFQDWSEKRNGEMRNTSGLITYTREPDGSISYSPAVKYLYTIGFIPTPINMSEKIY